MVLARLAPALLLVTAAAACDPGPPLEWGPCVPARVSHVERFGYYGGASSLGELSGYSNLSWGSGASTLTAASAAGIRAVVDLQGVFQVAAASRPADDVIAANWAAVAPTLLPDVAALAAIYPSDEPYLNGEKNGVAPAEIQRRLESVAQLVHSTAGFANVKLAAIFSDRGLEIMESGQEGMPAGYAWVGWDLYAVSIDQLEDHVNRFLGLVRADQRVIAVPEAFVWRSNPDVNRLAARIAFWLAWIESHPQVVAIAPFTYRSSTAWIGARDLPEARARYEQIGRCIIAAQPAP
jgi:hypothetical protein